MIKNLIVRPAAIFAAAGLAYWGTPPDTSFLALAWAAVLGAIAAGVVDNV